MKKLENTQKMDEVMESKGSYLGEGEIVLPPNLDCEYGKTSLV